VKLGEGAFGQVFLGKDEAHGEVAVKVLSRKASWTDVEWGNWKKSFLTEAQHLSRAAHEHVVKVHHIAAADDGQSVVICMAFCPGGSLQKRYEQGPMTIGAVREVATDVLLGLQCLHLRDMIHRDIKPANILLDTRGKALIGDFGLVTDDLVLGYASQAGYSDHIAYEVWMGKGTSVKSDIWAFGATLYRLLHGKQWYEELPPPRDLIAHGGFADQLPWLPHVPKRWRRVIRQMMEDDAGKRYPTAEAALSAVSSLPVAPIWESVVTPDMVRWQQTKGGRLHVAEWTRKSRQHRWSAWSEPLPGTKGQKKTLGGSNGVVTAKQAMSGLENYLG
jgi:serine/threonine-protein kinase